MEGGKLRNRDLELKENWTLSIFESNTKTIRDVENSAHTLFRNQRLLCEWFQTDTSSSTISMKSRLKPLNHNSSTPSHR